MPKIPKSKKSKAIKTKNLDKTLNLYPIKQYKTHNLTHR